MDTIQQTTIDKITAMLQPLLEGTDMFLVNIGIKPTNNLRVYIDADGGFDVGKSAKVNRALYAAIEASGMFPDGNFSLEVSSPGIDEPLAGLRQYRKNIGRTVEVTPLEGNPVTGILRDVTEEKITIEEKATKKKPAQTVEIPFSFIKTAIVQVVFK